MTEPSRRQMVYSAAAMYGGAALTTLVEGLVPGGPEFSPVPGIAAFGFVLLLLAVGRRLPLPALAALGPIGAALIAYALATTPPDQTDGALLYVWPVLWVTYFFGRTGAILIVAWVALVQAVALLSMSAGVFDRWWTSWCPWAWWRSWSTRWFGATSGSSRGSRPRPAWTS